MKEKELDSLKNVLDMKEKEKELDSLKNIDYVKYFNKEIRDDWWKQDMEVKKNLLAAIPVMIKTQKYLIKNNLKPLYIKKLAGNYNAINCKLSSNERLKDTKNSTRDHIIGVALIGDTVWDSIKEESLNMDNYKDWIYDNLFLWGGVDMKRYEHNKNCIERGNPKHDLMYKTSFNHYLKLKDEIIGKIIINNKTIEK